MSIHYLPSAQRTCDHCEHAAFNSSGVYCTVFHEDIWNERVAEECGMYDEIPAAQIIRFTERNDNSDEAERVLVFSGKIPFYGRSEQAQDLLEEIIRHMKVWFGEDVEVQTNAS